MGEVYRADDLKLGHPVALKFLPRGLEAEPGRRGRFLNEVRLALKVTHPNVCRVHDVGETDGEQFLSMEYVDGEDLASLLRRIGRFPRDRAVRVTQQLCAGLAAAHEQGILHRDLKPSNVMIDGRGQVKIADFGLAGIAQEMEGAQAHIGTPAYMAPEQLERGEVSVRSEVYALGLVLYELFTGKPAFEARTPAELARLHRDTTPVSPARIVDGFDAAVERLILRCLEKDPRLRPSSALAVAAALPGGNPLAAALAAGETPSPELLAEAGQTGGLSPALAWAGLAAFLGGGALVVLLGGKAQLVRMVPLDKPPAVLAERAREIVGRAGFAEEPADSLHAFAPNDAYLRNIEERGAKIDPWAPLRRSRPAGLLYWYRQSPQPLVKFQTAGLGDWLTDPPNVTPGMVQVALDPAGRLQYFTAVPPEREEDGHPTAGLDWSPLLAAAGLDPGALREGVPSWNPPVFADRRAAWDGVYPDAPDVPIHVEAASCGRRAVWFRIIEPWTGPVAAQGGHSGIAERLSHALYMASFLIAVIGAAVIAARNVRLGRGDRRTALRLAFYLGAIRMLWLLGAHHLSTPSEVEIVIGHFAFAWYRVGLVLIFYLAFEPYARRLWPHMLVSWVRLFSGRFRDPLVGRDLLVGAVFGVASSLCQRLIRWTPGRLGLSPALPDSPLWSLEALRGMREALAATVAVHTTNVLDGLVVIILLLVARLVLRRTWAAILAVTSLALPLIYGGTGSIPVYVVFALLLLAMFWLVLFRFGLLSLIAGMSIGGMLNDLPVTFDLTAWYAGAGSFALCLILGVAVWAFRTSVAGRPLFRDEILEAGAGVR